MRYLLLAALMATIPSAALFAETDSADDRLFDLGRSELAAVEVIDLSLPVRPSQRLVDGLPQNLFDGREAIVDRPHAGRAKRAHPGLAG